MVSIPEGAPIPKRSSVSPWTAIDSSELYEVDRWGKGYFSIDPAGRLRVHPDKSAEKSVVLVDLVERLRLQDVHAPILIRFNDIIRHRLVEIHEAFAKAREDHDYGGGYCCVYPIKVNQQRQVVDEVLRIGSSLQFGLEAGSKPELLAVIAIATDETPIICNGFKDADYIKTAMLAKKMGRHIIPVVEKFSELDLILRYAEEIGVRPTMGMRIKLATPGSGRWHGSGGYGSKFGLTVSELLRALDKLKSRGMEDCFQLLHFHVGSQIPNIRVVKAALTEAARVYVELARTGAGLQYLDVGGGLGVDYDGSQTNFDSSVNYTLQEYANDVVYHIQTTCDEAGVPQPTIVSESGRAVAAYHSMLVFNVLGVSGAGEKSAMPDVLPEEYEQPLFDLLDTYRHVTARNAVESYHDAQQALDMALNLFAGGYLPIEQRAIAEHLFWGICRKLRQLVRNMEYVHEDLSGLDAVLADTYFCNFSLFQSMPDSWAIKQLFPIMPIHRLDRQPTRRAVLGDVTCDSDGKVTQFIDRRDVKHTLPLHELGGEPYYLGVFLLGAYQEILGDLHNLFGDTNAVHVRLADGEVVLDAVINGDTVREVLAYVEFDAEALTEQMRTSVERAQSEGRLTHRDAGRLLRFYKAGLRGYTYLSDAETEAPPSASVSGESASQAPPAHAAAAPPGDAS